MPSIGVLLRTILFLVLGLGLLFVPYEKFQTWFPNAPRPGIVKIIGVVVLLCGILLAFLSMA